MAQTTLRDYLQEIEDAITSGRIDDALTRCQYVLTYFPEALEAQRLLGEVYLAQRNLEEAQQMFDWVLTNDPENIIAYCDRALLSEHQADFETALDCYQQAYELSRGNSQIRRQFNELSAKTGQQGFMFSRAGLARLYMWGDLLSQASQEWEAVLAAGPDRLDVRVGLLETYWREGLYEQVEQLARHILQDVPGCLKALILLALVVSERNMQEAQELLQRIEALDPELVMVQELLADTMASQPSHPFVKLLKKPPVLLEMPAQRVIAPMEEAVVVPQASPHDSFPPQALAHWNDLSEWNGIDTPVKPRLHAQLVLPDQPSEARSTPASHTVRNGVGQQVPAQQNEDTPAVDPWAELERAVRTQPQENDQFEEHTLMVGHTQGAAGTPSPENDQFAVQQPPQEGVHPAQTHVAEQEGQDQSAEVGLHGSDMWHHPEESNAAFAGNEWTLTGKEEHAPAVPAWLSMLTQEQFQQPTSAVPSPRQEQKGADERIITPQAAKPEPTIQAQPSWGSEPHAPPSTTPDEEESFSFGPEWLKSLGAATMDDASIEEQSASTLQRTPVFAEPEPKAVFSPWTVPTAEPQSSSAQDLSGPQVPAEAEQSFLKTLEDLDYGLRTQAFIPLEPNSLSGIAQTQQEASSSVTSRSQAVSQDKEQAQEEPAFSSALAQLGTLASSSTPAVTDPAARTQSAPQPGPGISPVEPLWVASLSAALPLSQQPITRAAPPKPAAEPPAPTVSSVPGDALVSPVQSLPQAPLPPVKQEPPAQLPTHVQEPPGGSPVRVEASLAPGGVPQAEPTRPPSPSSEPTKVPTAHEDALLADELEEDELEATMKRPAIRPPSVQHQPTAASREAIHAPSNRSVSERAKASKTADASPTYRERLLKGYQHQLVGDYDEAMQEYRSIIRNAPELLNDVVSNVRALLKLAPKYAAGYRALGDAYMRQGEYLQAMEVYNKALTLAKRAKV